MEKSINFLELKYNLYELLNINIFDTDEIIKKNFNKIVKKFHPDKNSNTEIDIYNHIILSKKILLDNNLRQQYNNFINKKEFNDLKIGYKNHIDTTTNYTISYFDKEIELNKIHGYDNDKNKINVIKEYDNVIINRTINIDIKKLNCENSDDFNNKFIEHKEKSSIINTITDIQIYQPNLGNYANINDIHKLYVNGPVQTELFTSLEKAFTI